MSATNADWIQVEKDGPYLVSQAVPIAIRVIVPNREGLSWEWQEGRRFDPEGSYRLCRCGQSKDKPFCDDSHLSVGFDGTETASHEPYDRQAGKFEGPTMELRDQESLCAFARFCDPGGKIWALIERTDDPQIRDLTVQEAMHCPSGRLVLHDRKDHEAIEEKLPKSIGVVEDPALEVSGPLWIRGGIPVTSAEGKAYEIRNRMTLCRCGASSNKPFCDGSHASIKFKDGLQP